MPKKKAAAKKGLKSAIQRRREAMDAASGFGPKKKVAKKKATRKKK